MRKTAFLGLFGGSLIRASLIPRDTSPDDICFRWSHQSAIVKNTLYLYGGQRSTDPLQTENTWNNYFWSLDLSQDFQIASAPVNGLTVPSGPPAVSNGYLWNDYDSLYLYGGEYSWKPIVSPDPFSLWKYSITDGSWSQPQTTVTSDGPPVQRAAEGAGVSIPHKGIGFYFSGHQDDYTTNGWSHSTPRLYLNSMIEYDMNTSEWTNRTVGADAAGFPKRADGVLLYVPWGDDGILVSLAGGTNQTFNQLNIVDIYDIKTSTWSKQATSGTPPGVRVNPCAVVFSASDKSSHNIYMFGGQNLIPFGSQTQYSDTWILTIPSFTWIKVDDDKQSVPLPRAGHSCNAYRGQMIVVGGYLGGQYSCDSPGVYIFDASTLQWKNDFKGGSTGAGSLDSTDSNDDSPSSLLYSVPAPVIALVGGNGEGGATVTSPQQTPEPSSPLTGDNPDYTYSSKPPTSSTSTSKPSSSSGSSSSHSNGGGSSNQSGNENSSSGSSSASANNNSSNNNNNNNTSSSSAHRGLSTGTVVGAAVGGILVAFFIIIVGMYIFYRRQIKRLRASLAEAKEAQALATSYRGSSSSTFNCRSSEEMEREFSNLEPTFLGWMLRPRRSLRVVNK